MAGGQEKQMITFRAIVGSNFLLFLSALIGLRSLISVFLSVMPGERKADLTYGQDYVGPVSTTEWSCHYRRALMIAIMN